MKHITVASDSKYLVYGLALVRSLFATSSIPITVHYYCADERTYDVLQKLDMPFVCLYRPETLYTPAVLRLKETDLRYFFWSLASVFTQYIMKTVDCDSVTYIDSDILFHKDIKLLYDAFGDKSCGIFRHRFLRDNESSQYGSFNVGVVYFKKSEIGVDVLDWWADAVVHRKYPELATCGDQKYLDRFPDKCEWHIYIDEGIGHGAPWNWKVYGLDRIAEGMISYRGAVQPLVFTHFSKFSFNIDADTFECTDLVYSGYTNSNRIYNHAGLRALHSAYFEELKVASHLISNAS